MADEDTRAVVIKYLQTKNPKLLSTPHHSLEPEAAIRLKIVLPKGV
jgi:hypothetical protein